MSQTELAKALVLPKSSLCEHVHDLAAAAYVSWSKAGSRPKVKITDVGFRVSHETMRGILEELAVAARATADVELLLFVGISKKLVAHAAFR